MQNADQSPLRHQSRELRVARFREQLSFLLANFRFCRETMRGRRTFNESIADLKAAQRPRARRAPRRRLDPQVEFVISWMLAGRGITEPGEDDIREVCAELSGTLKAGRRRPDDHILRHHVEALAFLLEDACGEAVKMSMTKNSIYDPHLKGPSGELLLRLIRSVDPSVTETSVVNIIKSMRRTRGPGSHFHEYFPLAGRAASFTNVQTIGPAPVGIIWPIYCS